MDTNGKQNGIIRPKHNTTENLIYLFIWVVVFVLPVFAIRENGVTEWSHVRFYWQRTIPLLILFLVNNYLLVPRLLLRNRFWPYLLSVLAAMLVIFSVYHYGIRTRLLAMPQRPEVLRIDTLPGDSFIVTARTNPHESRPHKPDGDRNRPDRSPGERHDRGPEGPPRRELELHKDGSLRSDNHIPLPMAPLFNDWILGILLIGFNIAIRYMFKSMRDERQIKDLESHTLQAELNYLKTQINPHFFMNTLNNIHALIDFDTEKAKETVIELSKIMRYVLYDADQPTVLLSREVQFLNNYVALMRIRFTDEVDIKMEIDESLPDAKVPPVLLVTLIENAFKHGISYRRDSFIHGRLWAEEGQLYFTVENSVTADLPPKAGVGIDNMRKRLSLLYGTGYTMEVVRTAEKYSVTLVIPVQ